MGEVDGDVSGTTLYHVLFDGSVTDEHGFIAIGGHAEDLTEALKQQYQEGWDLATAVKTGVTALGAPDQRQIEAERRRGGGPGPHPRASPEVPPPRRRRGQLRSCRRARSYPHPPENGLGSPHGAADLRARERVRGHVHVPRTAAALARRGGPLPVPTGRALGPVLERLPGERRPAVPGRRLPPRVRHARVRRRPRAGRPRQGGGADPGGAAGRGRDAAARGGHQRPGLPVQEQHRLGRQLLRMPRELPRRPPRRVRAHGRRADPVLRDPADLLRRRQGAARTPRRAVLHLAARRAHLGRRLVGDDALAPDHQHARRAARRRRALPAAARDRRRLEHERVDDVHEGRHHRPGVADGGGEHRDARPDAREPDPRDPRDQPRHHVHAAT